METQAKSQMKNIVILGAGFGGMRLAFLLHKKLVRKKLLDRYRITLVDKNDYHTYTPMLYEIATTSHETATDINLHSIATFFIPGSINRTTIQFIKDTVQKIDIVEGSIELQNQRISFDYLVLALGSEPNYFNIGGLEKYSLSLKTFDDAMKIRDVVLEKMKANPSLQIVIGGAGSTGVETAGEMKEAFPSASVAIIEGSSSILPGFDTGVVQKANERLRDLKIDTILGEQIKTVQKSKIILSNKKEVPYDLLVWAGGVKASHLLTNLPIKLEARGRAEVIDEMECLPVTPNLRLHGQVYALGDSVCFHDQKTQRPVPGIARAAIVQAGIIAENIAQDILRKENKIKRMRLSSYQPSPYPYVIPIGGKYAIANIGRFIIDGKLGWILKLLVEINYIISIMPFWHAVRVWIRGIKIFVKNDRLG